MNQQKSVRKYNLEQQIHVPKESNLMVQELY